MKRQFSTALAVSLAAAIQLGAADLYVTDNANFQTALDTAQANGEADTIHVAAGIYNISTTTTLTYVSSVGENYSLTIQGAGADSTILDGDKNVQIMDINTSSIPDDWDADITIKGITFHEGVNKTTIVTAGGGGLIVRTNLSNINVEDSIFSNNFSAGYGGGVYANSSHGNVTLTNNTFNVNSALMSGGGAAAYTLYGNVTLTNNTFSGNSADDGGGGVYARSESQLSKVTLTNNTFSTNAALSSGGGAIVLTSAGTAILTNNTFSDNTALDFHGGGAYVLLFHDLGNAVLYNNIIWNNTAGGEGDDLFVDNGETYVSGVKSVKLYNNNLGPNANFTTGKSEDLYIVYTDTPVYLEADNLTVNPLFADAAFHLSESSPLIDEGNVSAPALPATDFEGDNRVIDGNDDGTALPDIGADEYVPDQLAQPDIDVTPTSLGFGDVIVGNSKELSVTVSNSGNANLTVNSVATSGANAGEFSLFNGCTIVEPGNSCTVTVTFTPTTAGSKTATLSIKSDDPDEATVDVSLAGNAKSPEDYADDIIKSINDLVEFGYLVGKGKGKSADKRLNALMNMIETAKDLIEQDRILEACNQLHSVDQLTDGDPIPGEFVQNVNPEVDAVKELNDMIQELMDSLSCS